MFSLMKEKIVFIFLFLVCFFVVGRVQADYVLPYPSYMPGNKLYKVSRLLDEAKSWWYWGSIGQTKYHMELADKYLVEAKTLFEYKQYILARSALAYSNEHIAKVPLYIARASKEQKRVAEIQSLFASQLHTHIQVLEKLKLELPKTFVWTPEKEPATTLNLFDELTGAITARRLLL